MRKKAFLMDIFVWIIIGFISILLFSTWIYGWGLLTEKLKDIENIGKDNNINVSKAADDTFGAVDRANSGWHLVAFAIIFAMGVSIFISNFLVKAHPVFFIVYVFITVIAVIFSAYVSNVYETLMTNSVLGPTISGFSAGSFIMLNLPVWSTIIGIFGAIFLFMGTLRDKGAGEGLT